MKRILWIGVAVLVAAVVLVPAWIAFGGDDDGGRRAGALEQPAAGGADVGTLTLVGELSGTLVVPVQSFSVEALSPRDAVSGASVGSARRGPLKFIKPIDSSSPTLFKMVTRNEGITSARLDLRRTGATGKLETYMSYTFGEGRFGAWDDGKNETIELYYSSITSTKPTAAASGLPVIGQMTVLGQTVPITGFATRLISPTDPATGQATGKRQHKPFAVTRYLDPLASNFLARVQANQGLGEVKVELQRSDPGGKPVTYATYTYSNAFASSVEDSGAAGSPPTERLEAVFQTVEVKVGTNAAVDDWEAPVEG